MKNKNWNNSSDKFKNISDALLMIKKFITRPSVQKYLAGTTLATITEEDDGSKDATEDMMASAAPADLGYESLERTGNLHDRESQNKLPPHMQKQGVVQSAKAAGGSDNYGLRGATTTMETFDSESESELKKRPLSSSASPYAGNSQESEWSNELQPRGTIKLASSSNPIRSENPRRTGQAEEIAANVVEMVFGEISRERAFANPDGVRDMLYQVAKKAALDALRQPINTYDMAMGAAMEAAMEEIKPNDNSSDSSVFSTGLGGGSRKRKPSKIPRRTIRRGAPRRTQRRTQKRHRMQGRRFTRQRKNNKRRTTQKRR
jgi:hypothetical protein